MIKFFKGLKRAADYFNVKPDEVSLRDVQILKHLEYDLYDLRENIKILQSKFDKKQVQTPTQLEIPIKKGISLKKFDEYWEAKVKNRQKLLKIKPVEEEFKKVKSRLTHAQVKRLFEYRDGELYWKINNGNVKKGDKAGYVWSYDGYTYKSVSYKGRCYTISRLIFLIFHGYLPRYVTYIDGNSLNTRIENLRAATHSQIMTYRGIRKNNTSGFKGVKYSKNDHKWIAAISKNKKYYHLGSFDTPEEAYIAYCKAARKLHGEFAQVA